MQFHKHSDGIVICNLRLLFWVSIVLTSIPIAISSSVSQNETSITNNRTIPVQCEDCDDDDDENNWWNDANMKLIDMWNVLKCDNIFKNKRPVYTEAEWSLMRGAYVGTVGPDHVVMDAFEKKEMFGGGFSPGSVEVKVTENKGRSIHATKPFKKGQVIWTALYTACFYDGMAYRQFLASIPDDLACDVLKWAYSSVEWGVCVDLDEGSLMNHSSSKGKIGQAWESSNEKPNVANSEDAMETGHHIAISDINPGDELLIDYTTFAEDAWSHFGLGTWKGQNGVIYVE